MGYVRVNVFVRMSVRGNAPLFLFLSFSSQVSVIGLAFCETVNCRNTDDYKITAVG